MYIIKGDFMNKKRTQIYLPIPQTERLKFISEQKGISLSELIRRILDKYLDKE